VVAGSPALLRTPFLFGSDVTLFFDEDYFRTFLPAASASARRSLHDGGWVEAGPADAAAIQSIAPPLPDGLGLEGGVWLREFEEGRGVSERMTWVWAFRFR